MVIFLTTTRFQPNTKRSPHTYQNFTSSLSARLDRPTSSSMFSHNFFQSLFCLRQSTSSRLFRDSAHSDSSVTLSIFHALSSRILVFAAAIVPAYWISTAQDPIGLLVCSLKRLSERARYSDRRLSIPWTARVFDTSIIPSVPTERRSS